MPRLTIDEVGRIGIVKDVPAHTLAPEVWTDGSNVRFIDGKAVKMKGEQLVFDPPTVAPHWAMSVRTPTNHFWLYTSLTKAYALTGGVHTDITRASGDYGAGEAHLWNGGILGGIPIINNGVDDPQMWSPPEAGTQLIDLDNWPANTLCQVIKPFKNQLIALDITDGSDRFAHRVKYSDIADPGTVPSSWDETDPTNNAGENDLSDTQSGIIRDGLGLRDIFVVYKDSATWGMQPLEDTRVFRFYPILTTSGIMSVDCVKTTPQGTHHFLMTGDDLVLFDGQSVQSLIDKRQRRALVNSISSTNFGRSFVMPNYEFGEMWFCYPEEGITWPNRALVWNMRDGSLGERVLDDISFIAVGIVDEDEPDDTWDGASGVWDTDADIWDKVTFNTSLMSNLGCDPVNTALRKLDSTNQFRGTNMRSYVERTGIPALGQDQNRQPVTDLGTRKLLKRIWPRVEGGPIQVVAGSQEELEGPVAWSDPQEFDPKAQHYIDVAVHGRLLAIRFESEADVSWELRGYDLEVEVLGDL